MHHHLGSGLTRNMQYLPTHAKISYQQSTTGFCLAELAGARQRVSVLHWPCRSNFVLGVGGLKGCLVVPSATSTSAAYGRGRGMTSWLDDGIVSHQCPGLHCTTWPTPVSQAADCVSRRPTRARTTHAAPITPHRASPTPSFARVSCPCLASSIRRMSEESSKAEVNAKTECERPGTRDRALMQVCLSNEHDSAAAG